MYALLMAMGQQNDPPLMSERTDSIHYPRGLSLERTMVLNLDLDLDLQL
jgi:hypothetical protein